MCEESQIQGKRITVVGAGVSGGRLDGRWAELREGVSGGGAKEVTEGARKLCERAGIDDEGGGKTGGGLEADEVVVSSGISPKAPIVAEALKRGMRVTGELDFVNPYLSGIVIGVTGSNGKTTTTSMIGYFLEKLGYSVMTGGNIGNAVAHAAGRDYDFIVLELSSFQLYWAREFMCDLAIVTNLAPDHIDWHGSYENYVASKANLINCLAPGGAAIYQKRDEEALHIKDGVERFPLSWHEDDPHAQGIYLDEQVGAAWINGGGCRMKHRLFLFGDVKLLGRHNLENAAMAAGALAIFNTPEITPELMGSYVPPKHRCAFAGKLCGVTFVDDSKGTNVAASITAMTSLPGTKVILLGGQGTGEEYAPPAAARKQKARTAVILGTEKEKIASALAAAGFENYSLVKDMDEAVRSAWKLAQEGDTVLLSPACTSWDMYPSYKARGADFCRVVDEIIESEG